MDVGEDTTRRDRHVAEEDVEFLVVANCKLKVAGNNTSALVVTGGIAGEFKDLSTQVLEDGSQVHRCATAEAGSKVLLAHVTSDTADGELQSRASRSALALGIGAAAALALALALARHDSVLEELVRGGLKVVRSRREFRSVEKEVFLFALFQPQAKEAAQQECRLQETEQRTKRGVEGEGGGGCSRKLDERQPKRGPRGEGEGEGGGITV